MRVNY